MDTGNKWLNIIPFHIEIGKNMKTLKYDIKSYSVNLAQYSIEMTKRRQIVQSKLMWF